MKLLNKKMKGSERQNSSTGYFDLSNVVLFAVDIVSEWVELIYNKKSLMMDKEIEEYLLKRRLNLQATTGVLKAYVKADYYNYFSFGYGG